ncbi:MAG: hypothetical protein KJ706_01205 [Candidatus Omnitrophica bacterium]|nr:hypothetical protein [Candidatus Omnitrophota bacterium]MBU4590530.1 hypothetical protein [Candidatus Omnitrophota bacterium]
MDDNLYNQLQDQKYQEHEALCKRCGACCGAMEEYPCEHLKKGEDSRYFCDIYEERFGLRKTLSGEPILCVPIRNMLSKTWWGRTQCAYVRHKRRII